MVKVQRVSLLFASADRQAVADLLHHMEPACARAGVLLDGSGALSGGTVVAEALAQSVATAQRVLCFVTVDLLRDAELLTLAGRARAAGTLVPVLGRPCGWADEPTFAALHPLPQDGRPLSQQPDREAALVTLVSQALAAVGPRASAAWD